MSEHTGHREGQEREVGLMIMVLEDLLCEGEKETPLSMYGGDNTATVVLFTLARYRKGK